MSYRSYPKLRNSGYAAAIAALIISIAPASCEQSNPYVEGQSQSGSFYRLKASYLWKETGEPLEVDFVVTCSAKITRWRGGGNSYDSSWEPRVMVQETPDGGAILVRSLNICTPGYFEKTPEHIFPLAIVFDDVNDLSFGWGYATEDAYDSPHSKLTFVDATIARATREDFNAWRERAAEGYEQKGMLPGPWGYSYHSSKDGRQEMVREAGEGRDIANLCRGYQRIALPGTILEQLLARWPEEAGRYWLTDSVKTADKSVTKWVREIVAGRDSDYGDGLTWRNFVPEHGADFGQLNRDGGGFFNPGDWKKVPTDHFPLVPRSRATVPLITEATDSYPRRILVDDEWKGFIACGGQEPVDILARGYYSPQQGEMRIGRRLVENPVEGLAPLIVDQSLDIHFRDKEHPLYIGDDVANRRVNPLVEPMYILDREGYVFYRHVWGYGGV